MIHECELLRTNSRLGRTGGCMVWKGRREDEKGGEGKVGDERKTKRRGGRKGKEKGRGGIWEGVKRREGGNYFDHFF